nr:MAG TPA: hypothetical protein [Caudoviricetes sp.]
MRYFSYHSAGFWYFRCVQFLKLDLLFDFGASISSSL